MERAEETAKEALLLPGSAGNGKVIIRKHGWLMELCDQFHEMVSDLYAMGKSDPRKVIFSVKVGFSLALVAVLIFWDPLESASKYSIWAILTVVVVFEFSVGATLSKGFNRGLGTISAGGIALGIGELAMRSGSFEEVILVASIFWAGFLATYVKLYPTCKPYEYGFRVFLLTFCLVLVSGNSSSNFYLTAFYRLIFIGIGASVAFIVNIFIFPIWAGEDLHKLVVKNFRGIATSLEVCVDRYVLSIGYPSIPSKILTFQAHDDPLYAGYRTAVQSYSKEESLLEFARWEPPHGPYWMLKYPWENYVKVAGAIRHCAFMVLAMHGSILSEIQAPPHMRQEFANEFQRVGSAGARVLRELGNKLEKMEKLRAFNILQEVHEAAEDLQLKIQNMSHKLVSIKNWDEQENPKDSVDDENHVSPPGIITGFGPLPEEEEEVSLDAQLTWHDARVSRASMIDIERSESGAGSMYQTAAASTASIIGPKWPSLHSILVSEKAAAASASSLSLATFSSLLVEFVARLDNVVGSYRELSVLANFKYEGDPVAKKIGCWGKLMMCFHFKK